MTATVTSISCRTRFVIPKKRGGRDGLDRHQREAKRRGPFSRLVGRKSNVAREGRCYGEKTVNLCHHESSTHLTLAGPN
jgi:hypothetical protein